MEGYVWSCSVMYSYAGLCIVIYGFVGLCSVLYASVGLCSVVYTYLLHIMCGYQCDKAVNKNDTREVI